MRRFVLALVAALTLVAPAGAVTLSDPAISESSWLALSPHDPGLLFTGNDEPGPFFGVDSATGKTAGKNTLSKTTLVDPESADFAPNSGFWLADLGDNTAKRTSFTLYAMADPGRGNHTIIPEKYPVRYGDGRSHNAEAFFIKPSTGNRYIITKEASGLLFRNDVGTLDQGTVGTFRAVGSKLPAYVTEAKFTPDSRFVFARQKDQPDTVTVLDGEWFKTLGRFSVPKVNQPESLATDGNFVWLGSEGSNSPLVKVPVPAAYRTKTDEPDPEPNAQILQLSKFKRTLPTGKKGSPTEVDPLKDATGPVTFRAPVDGVTTSGSSYSRDELREKTGDALAKWSNEDERHRLAATARVTEIPGRKSGSSYVTGVVFGQIHDGEDDVVILLVNTNGDIVLEEGLGKGKGAKKTTLFTGYRLGDSIQYVLDAHDGVIDVTVNGKRTRIKKAITGAYFKAGCYLRGNATNATGAGEVVMDALEENHTA